MATISQKINLLRGLLTGEYAYTGPFYAQIDLTRRCNLRCLCCRYHSNVVNIPSPGDKTISDISLGQFKKVCTELKSMGTPEIILTGEGEPLLHPHLTDMISFAKDKGMRVTLITNGTLLDEKIIRFFIEAPLDKLKVSLWASSLQNYEQNYPGTNPAYFKKVVEELKQLSDMKKRQNNNLPVIVLHQPINIYNFKNIDATVDIAHQAGTDLLAFSCLWTGWGEASSFALPPEEEKVLILSLRRMKKRLKALSINHNIDEVLLRYRTGEAIHKKLPCYVGWYSLRVKVDGTILPCTRCQVSLGSLGEKSLREIWNAQPFREFRKKIITRKGLASMEKYCDCAFCCLLKDNMRVHRLFKWFSPFIRHKMKYSHAKI